MEGLISLLFLNSNAQKHSSKKPPEPENKFEPFEHGDRYSVYLQDICEADGVSLILRHCCNFPGDETKSIWS